MKCCFSPRGFIKNPKEVFRKANHKIGVRPRNRIETLELMWRKIPKYLRSLMYVYLSKVDRLKVRSIFLAFQTRQMHFTHGSIGECVFSGKPAIRIFFSYDKIK